MDIHNIKRPGAYGPLSEAPTDTPTDSKPHSRFSDATAGLQEVVASKPVGIASQFSRADLEDPSKLEGMVRACASELINSSQAVTGALSPIDKQVMADFLLTDPLIRGQIENYLKKVLV